MASWVYHKKSNGHSWLPLQQKGKSWSQVNRSAEAHIGDFRVRMERRGHVALKAEEIRDNDVKNQAGTGGGNCGKAGDRYLEQVGSLQQYSKHGAHLEI